MRGGEVSCYCCRSYAQSNSVCFSLPLALYFQFTPPLHPTTTTYIIIANKKSLNINSASFFFPLYPNIDVSYTLKPPCRSADSLVFKNFSTCKSILF